MKELALIISFYLFTASVLPCTDVNKIVFSTHSSDASEQSDCTSDDDCLSLCICNCCGIVFEIPDRIIVPNAPVAYSHRVVPTTLSYLSDDLSNIWQPPKHS